MCKKIKSLGKKALLSIVLFTSYSYANNIALVKESIMKFDKSITVGQAFDNWERCKDKKWQEFQTNNKKKIVEFNCKVNKFDCKIQWLINLDDTTEVVYAKLTTKNKYGEMMEGRITPLQLFRAIYANE